MLTSWLIGSTRLAAPSSIVVDGEVEVEVPAGEYYLRDPEPGRSLVDVLAELLDGPLDSPTVYIAKDRRVRITTAAPFTLAFDVALLPILGFASNVDVPTTLAVADTPSSLLWSPGWVETPELTPRGVSGARSNVEALTASASGQTIHTTVMHTVKSQRFRWEHVAMERVWAPGIEDGEPGQFVRFRRDVLAPNRRWKLYSPMVEEPTNSATAAWPAPLGPYKRRKRLKSDWFERQFTSDTMVRTISLGCTLVPQSESLFD